MSPRITLIAGLALGLAAGPALADPARLTVHVSGAEPPAGTIEISLFDSAEKFFRQPYKQSPCKPSDDGRCTVSFGDLPDGEYAVIVVHDANDNRKLDNGFLGFGAERFAYSNGAANPLFGRASFDDAKFLLQGSAEIEIKLD